ncbi:hypothetical protein CPB97_008216 [Podila verticillata]|nr:hypothetical protein CPB97_008216 [Podila verticillata]
MDTNIIVGGEEGHSNVPGALPNVHTLRPVNIRYTLEDHSGLNNSQNTPGWPRSSHVSQAFISAQSALDTLMVMANNKPYFASDTGRWMFDRLCFEDYVTLPYLETVIMDCDLNVGECFPGAMVNVRE